MELFNHSICVCNTKSKRFRTCGNANKNPHEQRVAKKDYAVVCRQFTRIFYNKYYKFWIHDYDNDKYENAKNSTDQVE